MQGQPDVWRSVPHATLAIVLALQERHLLQRHLICNCIGSTNARCDDGRCNAREEESPPVAARCGDTSALLVRDGIAYLLADALQGMLAGCAACWLPRCWDALHCTHLGVVGLNTCMTADTDVTTVNLGLFLVRIHPLLPPRLQVAMLLNQKRHRTLVVGSPLSIHCSPLPLPLLRTRCHTQCTPHHAPGA